MSDDGKINEYERGYQAGSAEAYEFTRQRPLSEAQMRQLVANLNPQRVATRSQGRATLSYLEAWDVRATLTRIFGFGGWSADLAEPVKVLRIDDVMTGRDNPKPGFRALAEATVRVKIHQTGATYTESAVASQQGPDIGEVTDFAVKTAESDAFKRACINLGTQFGLSLYDDGSTLDVIKVVLEPTQQKVLAAVRDQAANRAATPRPASEIAAPDTDTPLALEVPQSRDGVRDAFNRSK